MSTALRLTLDDYHAMIDRGAFDGLDRRVELIRGELREMSPIGPIHCDLVDELTVWSIEQTTRQTIRVRVQSGVALLSGEPELDSEPEPDVVWLKPRRYANRRAEGRDVLLVIEVSDSSLTYDRGEKSELYAQSGLPEYWIVDVPGRQVLQFSNPVGSEYQTRRVAVPGDCISPACHPAAVLDVAALFDFDAEENSST